MTLKTSDPGYWDNLYQTNETAWDIGYPSPPLKEYIDQLTDKNVSILVPGCGNSYEAGYLLENGFTDVTLVDISPLLTSTLEKKFKSYLGKQLRVITSNFFDLSGKYDLMLEQTFFCALDPSLRTSYANKVHELINPGGKLAGVLFARQFEKEGPPFGGSKEEFEKLFREKFEIAVLEPCYNSIAPRNESEVFIKLKPKST
jgi:methyl halide transferase